jgi:hypothetical protein
VFFNGLFDVYIERQSAAVGSAVHAGSLSFLHCNNASASLMIRMLSRRYPIMMEPKKSQQEINPAGFLVLTIKN